MTKIDPMRLAITIQTHQSLQTEEQPIVLPTKVVLRSRPLNERELGEQRVVYCLPTRSYLYYPSFQVLTDPCLDVHHFPFTMNIGHHVDDMSENIIFLAHDALSKKNIVSIIAYGQTGSGKTFTMTSIANALPSLIFCRGACFVSILEVLGDKIQDLISGSNVQVLLDECEIPVLKGAEEECAHNPVEFCDIISRGFASRKTAKTTKNDTSSRSHLIFLIRIPNTKKQILLVDLAGSERNADSHGHDAVRMKESAAINTSLMALKNCILARGSQQTDPTVRVPFRSSKLTMILKEALCANEDSSDLIFIATVSPTILDVDHSLNTFRYAISLNLSTIDNAKYQKVITPMSWPLKTLDNWISTYTHGEATLALLTRDLRPTNGFKLPEWKYLYDMDLTKWTEILGWSESKAKDLRDAYKLLFIAPRAIVKTNVCQANIDTIPILDISQPKQAKLDRQQLARDKIKERGQKARLLAGKQ